MPLPRALALSAAVLIPALALAACQTVSEVTPVGRDTFMVGAQARGGLTTTMEVKQMAIGRAGTFCAAQGKRVSVVHVESLGVQGFTPQNSDVTFKCE